MKIALTGSTGFIGSKVKEYFSSKNNEIVSIRRDHLKMAPEKIASYIEDSDVVINLAGASIEHKWTDKYKKIIYDSRIKTTNTLVETISKMETKPKLLISASAVGIYDTVHQHTENSKQYENDFLSKVVQDWEKETLRAKDLSVRTVCIRMGIVLSENGGALAKLIPMFKVGLGAKLGSGEQYLPYIWVEDVLQIMELCIENKEIDGALNAVAPDQIKNKEFTKQLASKFKMPAPLKAPTWSLKLMYGEGAQALTKGQYVIPEKLNKLNYKYLKTSVTSF